ncbi:UvrB/UvrC motif-containing protein, partial [Planococcus sp. SIMBA_160]
LHVRRKLELMQQELKQLIEQEEFEKAAEVRDQIRALEHEQSQQREGD